MKQSENPQTFKFVYPQSDGYSHALTKDNKWGVLNPQGEVVIPCIYNNPHFMWEYKVYLVYEDSKPIFKNQHGEIIPPELWKEMNTFHEGLVTVVDENDHYGFADEDGHLVFPPKWDYAFYFENGYAYIREGENRYYIDHDGNKQLIQKPYPFKSTKYTRFDYLERMYFRKTCHVEG